MRMYMRCMYGVYMQRTYKTREMQTKAKEILDAAEAGEDVTIVRNGKVFRVVLAEGEKTPPVQAVSTDDLLTRLVEQSGQQTDLLRQLVEHKDTVLDDLVKHAKAQPRRGVDFGASAATVRVDAEGRQTESVPVVFEPTPNPDAANVRQMEERIARRKQHLEETLKAAHSRPVSAGDDAARNAPVEEPEPEKRGEPTEEELKIAYDYFGLRPTPDGLEITERGIRSGLDVVRKAARQDPESVEARVMAMGAADDERIEFLRCVQIDKLTSALAKREEGHERWLGAATPGI